MAASVQPTTILKNERISSVSNVSMSAAWAWRSVAKTRSHGRRTVVVYDFKGPAHLPINFAGPRSQYWRGWGIALGRFRVFGAF